MSPEAESSVGGALVVDASVALDWIFRSERSERANRVLEQGLERGMVVPAIWPAEVANGLLTAQRRGKLKPEDLPGALALFEELPVSIPAPGGVAAIRILVDAGQSASLTAYDAAYLELALRESAPLATHDEALRSAAERAGVELFV
ncbi:MAG: type II toxin-antitoxin system VapC family toxin [Planctomycetes bacterium]|nr:type II toxin-antitoxin system VapC family toxin [Planctomycetota bacterium]